MKIKNISQSAYGARTKTGVKMVEPGQVLEAEFDEGEAANLKANKAVFEVGDHVVAETSKGANGSGQRIAALEKQVADLTKERDDLKAQLAAGAQTEPVALADAVKALDDKNDLHWIASGKPNLEHLKHVTGNDALTRAEVDALNRVRVTA